MKAKLRAQRPEARQPRIQHDSSNQELRHASTSNPAAHRPRDASVDDILALQASAGNAAVTHWIQDERAGGESTPFSIQRAVAAQAPLKHGRSAARRSAPAEPFGPALNAAGALLDQLLQSNHELPNTTGLGPVATGMLWDLWKGGTGFAWADGKQVPADSASRLKYLATGQSKLDRFIHAYAGVSRHDARAYSNEVHGKLSNLRVWAYSVEAYERAEQLKPGGAPDLDVKREGEKERLIATAKEASDTIGKLVDSAKKVSDAMPDKEWLLRFPVFGDRDFGVALGHSNDVLTLITSILTLADSKEREKKVSELHAKLGPSEEHSTVGAVASIDEIYTTCLKGLTAVTKLSAQGAGLVAEYRGLEKTAEECFQFAEGVGEIVEPIVAVLEFSHGVLVLADKQATTDEKLDAAVDVYAGGVGLLGTMGAISAGAVAELTIPVTTTWMEFKWVMKLGVNFVTSALAIDLADTYNNVLRPDGNELAKHLDIVQRLYIVSQQATGAERKAGYKQALGPWTIWELQQATWDLAMHWQHAREHPLVKRFNDSGLAPLLSAAVEKNANPAVCISAGAALLKLLIQAFKESDKVLHDLYVETGWITEKGGEKAGKKD